MDVQFKTFLATPRVSKRKLCVDEITKFRKSIRNFTKKISQKIETRYNRYTLKGGKTLAIEDLKAISRRENNN